MRRSSRSSSEGEKKAVKKCARRGCQDLSAHLYCFLNLSPKCKRGGSTSRWHHISCSEHYCNECFDWLYRPHNPGFQVYSEWSRTWQNDSNTLPNVKFFVADELLPYWVQCAGPTGCGKWRRLPLRTELCDVDHATVRCIDCSRPEEECVSLVSSPYWITILGHTPLLRYSLLTPLVKEYFPEGVGVSPSTLRAVYKKMADIQKHQCHNIFTSIVKFTNESQYLSSRGSVVKNGGETVLPLTAKKVNLPQECNGVNDAKLCLQNDKKSPNSLESSPAVCRENSNVANTPANVKLPLSVDSDGPANKGSENGELHAAGKSPAVLSHVDSSLPGVTTALGASTNASAVHPGSVAGAGQQSPASSEPPPPLPLSWLLKVVASQEGSVYDFIQILNRCLCVVAGGQEIEVTLQQVKMLRTHLITCRERMLSASKEIETRCISGVSGAMVSAMLAKLREFQQLLLEMRQTLSNPLSPRLRILEQIQQLLTLNSQLKNLSVSAHSAASSPPTVPNGEPHPNNQTRMDCSTSIAAPKFQTPSDLASEKTVLDLDASEPSDDQSALPRPSPSPVGGDEPVVVLMDTMSPLPSTGQLATDPMSVVTARSQPSLVESAPPSAACHLDGQQPSSSSVTSTPGTSDLSKQNRAIPSDSDDEFSPKRMKVDGSLEHHLDAGRSPCRAPVPQDRANVPPQAVSLHGSVKSVPTFPSTVNSSARSCFMQSPNHHLSTANQAGSSPPMTSSSSSPSSVTNPTLSGAINSFTALSCLLPLSTLMKMSQSSSPPSSSSLSSSVNGSIAQPRHPMPHHPPLLPRVPMCSTSSSSLSVPRATPSVSPTFTSVAAVKPPTLPSQPCPSVLSAHHPTTVASGLISVTNTATTSVVVSKGSGAAYLQECEKKEKSVPTVHAPSQERSSSSFSPPGSKLVIKETHSVTLEGVKHRQSTPFEVVFKKNDSPYMPSAVTQIGILHDPFNPFNRPAEGERARAFTPDVMTPEEKSSFPEYSKSPVLEVYLMLRNLVLALWHRNCKSYLSLETCLESLFTRGLVRVWCRGALYRILHFLTRKGYVNSGHLANASLPMPIAGNSDRDSVVVLGAGPAGVGVARHLTNFGYRVTVLEGRSQAGGRCLDNTTLGATLNMGAMIITGIDNNPITSLCHQLGHPLSLILEDKCDLIGEHGRKPSPATDTKVDGRFNGALDVLAKWRQTAESDCSLEDKLLEIHKCLQITMGKLSQEEEQLFHFHLGNLEFACGAELSKVSARNWDHNDRFPQFNGPHATLPAGCQSVFTQLASHLNVRYNTVVTRVERRRGKDGEAEECFVTDEAGNVWRADRVVVTVPVAILKAGHIKFDPPLPETKLAAIDRIGVGIIEKVAVKFPYPFWRERVTTPHFFGRISKAKEDRALFSMFYDVIDKPTDSTGPFILVSVVCGAAMERLLREDITDQDLVERFLETLQSLFPDAAVPSPLGHRVTQWRREPLSLMSYSYAAVNSSGDDYKTLSQDVGNKIFFAGEATNHLYPQTVPGAYQSGVREAGKIIELDDLI